jgi:hypothetical protein
MKCPVCDGTGRVEKELNSVQKTVARINVLLFTELADECTENPEAEIYAGIQWQLGELEKQIEKRKAEKLG